MALWFIAIIVSNGKMISVCSTCILYPCYAHLVVLEVFFKGSLLLFQESPALKTFISMLKKPEPPCTCPARTLGHRPGGGEARSTKTGLPFPTFRVRLGQTCTNLIHLFPSSWPVLTMWKVP